MDQYEVVDESGKPTGQLVTKSVAHTNKVLHRVAGMLLHDGRGRYIIQYRPAVKGRRYYDASVGGHVDRGETPVRAAFREAKEELGMDLAPTDAECIAHDLLVEDMYPEVGVYARHMISFWHGQVPAGWTFRPNDEVSDIRMLTRDEVAVLCHAHPEECTKGLIAAVRALGWL